MPGGGLVQMVAQGAQDVYLVNGEPSVNKTYQKPPCQQHSWCPQQKTMVAWLLCGLIYFLRSILKSHIVTVCHCQCGQSLLHNCPATSQKLQGKKYTLMCALRVKKQQLSKPFNASLAILN